MEAETPDNSSDSAKTVGKRIFASVTATLETQNENDGKIVITIQNSDLEVRGDFFPHGEGGVPINPDYIRSLLEKYNIVYGINKEEINRAYKECVREVRIIKDVLMARGDPPVNEILEYMQLNPFLSKTNTDENENRSVDHRSRSPFTIVKKNQALAKQKSLKPGREGRNVHGESLGYSVTRPDGVIGGENTRMDGRLLLSNINGQLVIIKGIVSVQNSLLIKGSVGYSTGNIIFPGDVEIEGLVSDGFKIYSGGSVTIKQTFDVTDAITKGDLNVAGGIIGRGQAMVKVGGNLRTKFIENCRVACRKKITVSTEVLNSRIFTLETLDLGDKGKIVGGEVYALKGVRAFRVGKESGKAARIHCGIDFTVEQEKEKNNEALKIIAVKLNRLRELMAEPHNSEEKTRKMAALFEKLQEDQQKIQAKITELLGSQSTYHDAVVEISGDIVQGSLIEICQTAIYVTKPLKKVRIRYDQQENKLVTEKI